MKKKHALCFLAGLIFVVMPIADAAAEEPPHLSLRWRREARERIHMRVDRVKVKDVSDRRYKWKLVCLRARIVSVERTRDRLKKSDIIYIRYIHTYGNLPGPSSIPVLKEGRVYMAYLNPIKGKIPAEEVLLKGWDPDRQYAPAAAGKSFKEL